LELTEVAGWVSSFSYPAVIGLLIACGLGAPLSEEVILLTGGIVAAKGGGQLGWMMLAGYVGILLGDSTLYRIGRALGPRATKRKFLRKVLTEKRVAWVQSHFQRRGWTTLFLARFLPGFRAPTYLVAGMSGIPYAKFLLADASAALVSVPLIVFLGYHFGHAVLKDIETTGLILAVALGIALVVGGTVKWIRARNRPASTPKLVAALRDVHDSV
jgi:membrane-associated protein